MAALLALAAPSSAISTFPPSPEDLKPAADLLAACRVALFSGRAEQAYRLLLTAAPSGPPGAEWLEASIRVHVGLDRPLQAAEALSGLAQSDPKARERLKVLWERQGPAGARPAMTLLGERVLQLERKAMRNWVSALPGPGGQVLVLTDAGLLKITPENRIEGAGALTGGADLTLDWKGQPLALGAAQAIWGARRIDLPKGLDRPASLAASPDGNLILLDSGQRRLYRLDENGAVIGSAPLSVKEPVRVRLDAAGRVFVADRATGTVHVFTGGLAPLRVIDPEASGQDVRRVDDMAVDFAGDVLLLDGRAHSATLFSPQGRALATTGDAVRMDVFGWDGAGDLVYVNTKDGYLGRVGT